MATADENKLAEIRELEARIKASKEDLKEIRRVEREARRAAEQAETDRKIAEIREDYEFHTNSTRDWIGLTTDSSDRAELAHYDGSVYQTSIPLDKGDLASLRDYLISLNLG